MKKAILYILVGLTATTCIYNTYKITANNSNKVINKTVKEKFDSSSIDKKINDLTEENKKLTDEINLLKEENIKLNNQLNDVTVKLNSKTTPKSYDSDINSLKEQNDKLRNDYTELINCLFIRKMVSSSTGKTFILTNIKTGYNGTYGQLYNNGHCTDIINNFTAESEVPYYGSNFDY